MAKINPFEVDIRLAVGEPRGEIPIMLLCPMHKDIIGSLAVYRSNVHCFACDFHLKRRYSSLAFLLGLWSGRGSEDGIMATDAVKRLDLGKFVSGQLRPSTKFVPPPPDPITVEAFHQYFLRYGPLDRFMRERGLSLETIRRYRLGHTGTHLVIPVPDLEGGWQTLRYRAEDGLVDSGCPDYKKYVGLHGRNHPTLFPLSSIHRARVIDELWVTEGELDAIASIQAGMTTLTVTGGAGAVAKIADMIADELPWLQIDRWVIATDLDQAGEECANKLLGCLGCDGIRARWDNAKDLGEFFARGGRRDGIRLAA